MQVRRKIHQQLPNLKPKRRCFPLSSSSRPRENS